jgi:hypothetical protein
MTDTGTGTTNTGTGTNFPDGQGQATFHRLLLDADANAERANLKLGWGAEWQNLDRGSEETMPLLTKLLKPPSTSSLHVWEGSTRYTIVTPLRPCVVGPMKQIIL